MQDLIRKRGPTEYVIPRKLLPGFALTQVWGLNKLCEAYVSLSDRGGWSPQAESEEGKMDVNQGTHEQSPWNGQNWNPENGLEPTLTLHCFQASHFNLLQEKLVLTSAHLATWPSSRGADSVDLEGAGGLRVPGTNRWAGWASTALQAAAASECRNTMLLYVSLSNLVQNTALGLHSPGIVQRRESWRTEFPLSSADPLPIRHQDAPNQLDVTTTEKQAGLLCLSTRL